MVRNVGKDGTFSVNGCLFAKDFFVFDEQIVRGKGTFQELHISLMNRGMLACE